MWRRSAAGAGGTTGVDVAVREAAIGPALVVDGGEDVGVGPGVADGREHVLGAPQIEQEVVNQGGRARPSCGAQSMHRPQPMGVYAG